MPLSDKSARHAIIKELLWKHEVSTQSQLVGLLASQGKKVTQATISRDLQELGVFTDRIDNGKSIYIVPSPNFLSGTTSSSAMQTAEAKLLKEQLKKIVSEWVEAVTCSGNLVVIKTSPGSAHVVASALDKSRMTNVLATIAGDDTVFVVTRDNKNPSKTALHLQQELKNLIQHGQEQETNEHRN